MAQSSAHFHADPPKSHHKSRRRNREMRTASVPKRADKTKTVETTAMDPRLPKILFNIRMKMHRDLLKYGVFTNKDTAKDSLRMQNLQAEYGMNGLSVEQCVEFLERVHHPEDRKRLVPNFLTLVAHDMREKLGTNERDQAIMVKLRALDDRVREIQSADTSDRAKLEQLASKNSVAALLTDIFEE